MIEISPLTGLRRRADNLQPPVGGLPRPFRLEKRRHRSQSWSNRGLHLENIESGTFGQAAEGTAPGCSKQAIIP